MSNFESFDDYLARFESVGGEIIDDNLMPHLATCLQDNKISAPEDLSRLDEKDQERLLRHIKNAATQAVTLNNEYYRFKFLRILGDIPSLVQYITNHGINSSHGEVSEDLLGVALEFCNHQVVESAITDVTRESKSKDDWLEIEDRLRTGSASNGIISQKMNKIEGLGSQYREQFNLPNSYLTFSHINAAMEIEKSDYDLVVCVLNGGALLGNPLDIAGVNISYLECNRANKRTSNWVAIGRRPMIPQKAKRILIVEDDAVSGDTLKATIPIIRDLGADKIDVLFCGLSQERSITIAKSLSTFDNVAGMSSFSYKNSLEKLNEFKSKLEKTLKGNLT